MICNHTQVSKGGLVVSLLERLLDVHGLFFYCTLNIVFFILVISCESFNHFPFTSKDISNIFIRELIPYQQ
jgi:hypothetical protein